MDLLRVNLPRPCPEEWVAMAPDGRGRMCARCDKLIHDLSQYTLEEAEGLVRRSGDTCVRARVGADGAVALKGAGVRGARRMVVAAAVTAGLLAAAEPALAGRDRPRGSIAGSVDGHAARTRVVAADQSGRRFRTRVGRDGQYRIGHLPAGTYTVTFIPSCGDRWTVENVVVSDGVTIVPEVRNPTECIYIGLLRIEDSSG